jgi:membrane protein required for beta-lactamase induction
MDPVMTAAVVTAVIGAVGTVLAAWVQGRAQRSAKRADRQAAESGEPAASTMTDPEFLPNDRR